MQTFTSPEPLAAFASPVNDANLAALTTAGHTVPRKRISSQALLGNEREVEIEHGAQLYRLRITALGKLILTK